MSERDVDQQLVERVQKGDKKAFDLLVSKYQHRIMAVISRLVKEPDEIQDVAQDAFIKAYRAIPKFRGDSAFYTWMYRIAVNTAKNHLTARARRGYGDSVELDDAEYFESAVGMRDTATPDSLLARDEMEETINRVLAGLPDSLRTAVTLREFDGLSYEEIADIMDCPVGTVRSRIFRAREAIDQELKVFTEPDGVPRS